MYVCMYVCMCVYMHVCMYVCVCMYPSTHGLEASIAPNHDDRLGRGLVGNLAGVAVVRGAASPAHVSDFLANALAASR
jgi:hypothetical protein